MIEVRRAQVKDLPSCLDMTARFHAASPIAKIAPFDEDGMANTLRAMFEDDRSGVWLAMRDEQPVGIAGALLYPLYFSPSNSVVQELFWWLDPAARGCGAGKSLFQSVQNWAKDKGAAAVFMIALDDNRVSKTDKFYRRAGFEPLERTYVRGSQSWQ
jgi:GNAT superfamily N-acetyltransferase